MIDIYKAQSFVKTPEDGSTKQPARRLLGRIGVAGAGKSANSQRLVRVLTAIAHQDAASDIADKKTRERTPSPGAQLVRPKTMPAPRRGKAGDTDKAVLKTQPPVLPAILRAHLATHVPQDLEETLYVPGESPHDPGHQSDAIEVLTFHAPQTRTTYLITTPDSRTTSSAKRRRWAVAVTPEGREIAQSPTLCCLEFKAPDEMAHRPQIKEHLQNIQRELRSLHEFNRDIEVHALLRTADNRFLAVMTNLPEEGDYLLDQVSDALFDSAILRFFQDAAQRLHEDVHAKGFIHGDFKLSNVLVTDQGRASLIDLDSLQPLDASGQADIRLSSYFPPERSRPSEEGFTTRFGKSGDVFAVGLSLFDIYAEREAKICEMEAEDAPPANQQRLLGMAKSVRETKMALLEEMQQQGSGFHRWRTNTLRGGFDAEKIRQDNSLYARAVHGMQRRAPALFEHWLTSLVSDRAQDRRDLKPTLEKLAELRQQPAVRSTDHAVEKELIDITSESLSSFVGPALEEAASAVATPSTSPAQTP